LEANPRTGSSALQPDVRGCGHREATIVHHTTYGFGKKPPLWTLRGILGCVMRGSLNAFNPATVARAGMIG